jgi:hypothetical protein
MPSSVRSLEKIMTLFYIAAASFFLSGVGSMSLAVLKAEDGKQRLSLAFYVGAVALVVLAANLMSVANAKP